MVSNLIYYSEINGACMLFLAIILFFFARKHNRTKIGISFFSLLIASLVFCLSDLVAAIFRGQNFEGVRIILWISNISYFVSMLFIGYTWLVFCMALLKGTIYKNLYIILFCVVALVTLFNISTIWNGLLFTIDDANCYQRGTFIWIDYICIYPCYFLGLLFLYKSKVALKQKLAVILFPVFPLIGTVIQTLNYGTTYGQVGVTASIILIYLLLEGMEFNEQKVKVQIYDELSRTDVLTGLNNRRPYIKTVTELEDSSWVGVIFMDLNGLKETNDAQGHDAGDQLIRNFSVILKSIFKYEEVFRISGDEFVILTNHSKDFDSNISKLAELNNDVASYGIATGDGKDILKIIRDAELNMYEYKKNYYLTSGKDRRRY